MSLIEVQDLLTFIDGTEKEPKKVTLIENSRIGANKTKVEEFPSIDPESE